MILEMIEYKVITLLFCIAFLSFNSQTSEKENVITTANKNIIPFDTTTKTIHVYVALCDNKYQGIVTVPTKIGNGQDHHNNLYWGCGFGIRTYFKNSKEWKLIKTQKLDSIRLERLVFKHVTKNYYLVADAFDGQYIKLCTKDFLRSSSGQLKDTLHINNTTIGIAGNSMLLGLYWT